MNPFSMVAIVLTITAIFAVINDRIIKLHRTIGVMLIALVMSLCIIAAKQLGASRIIAMSRHADRQALARQFGATDIVEERGEKGIARIKEMTGGLGADGVVEAVGNEASFDQALGCVRPGGHLSFVGVPHGVSLDMGRMFGAQVHMFGGPAAVRKYLPTMIDLIYRGEINPGAVFDLVLPLEQAAEGYAAMDERRATKVMLTV